MQTEAAKKWPGFKYEPVPGLINRYIARYLRTQRKTMRRFFAERGFAEYFLRLEAIRKDPRLSMIQKNQQFKRILDDYAAQVISQRTPAPAVEAAATVQPASGLDLSTSGAPVAVPSTDSGADALASLRPVADADGDGPVIEE